MSKRKSCQHIRAVLKYMEGQGVFVATRDENPDLYCAVCKVSRPLRIHGDVKVGGEQ